MKKQLRFVISLLLISAFIAPHLLLPLPAEAAVSSWFKGAAIVPKHPEDFGSQSFKDSLAKLRATGANYVALVVPYYQPNLYSTDIGNGWNTPSDTSLISAIDYAHSLGMSVMIKVHAESNTGEWRGNINPSDRTGWFANYGAKINHLAQIAQNHNVEMFAVGTELVSMSVQNINFSNTQNWVNLISNVRNIYSGKVTYAANYSVNDPNDWYSNEKKFINFWPSVDYISLSAYQTLSSNSNASVETLKNGWHAVNTNDIKAFQQQYGKPLLLNEVGYRSIDRAYYSPWDYWRGSAPNEQDQANSYEALFSYWNDYSYLAGVFLWDWDTNPNAGGPNDTGYTPQGKLAETIMKNWYGGGSVPTTPPTPPPQPEPTNVSLDVTGSLDTQNPQPGNSANFSVSAHNTGDPIAGTIVDLEIYDQSGVKLHQQFFESNNFASGETKTFNTTWTPTASGNYLLKVGIFNSNWTKNYYWGDQTVPFTVHSGSENPPPTGEAILDIWWPTDGSPVSGNTPFKAMLQNRDLGSYSMYWQVDGDRLNDMYDSSEDYPHKEAWVDVSGWNWKGSGPYNIHFVAKDSSGNIIGQKSVNITIQ